DAAGGRHEPRQPRAVPARRLRRSWAWRRDRRAGPCRGGPLRRDHAARPDLRRARRRPACRGAPTRGRGVSLRPHGAPPQCLLVFALLWFAVAAAPRARAGTEEFSTFTAEGQE